MRARHRLSVAGVAALVLVAVSACAGSVTGPSPRPRPALELATCRVSQHKALVRCGVYEVFENRERRSGRRLTLNVVVLPAVFSPVAPDPILALAGGPGQGAATLAELSGDSFLRELRQHRDLVFVDQRGTGRLDSLTCRVAAAVDDRLEQIRICRRELESFADLTMYTTPIAVDDLDEV